MNKHALHAAIKARRSKGLDSNEISGGAEPMNSDGRSAHEKMALGLHPDEDLMEHADQGDDENKDEDLAPDADQDAELEDQGDGKVVAQDYAPESDAGTEMAHKDPAELMRHAKLGQAVEEAMMAHQAPPGTLKNKVVSGIMAKKKI